VVNSSYLDHHIGEYIVIGFVGTMAGVLVAALISLTFQKTEDIDVGDLEDHD
jgi:ABC-type lipoprotein release transport system permease subunit